MILPKKLIWILCLLSGLVFDGCSTKNKGTAVANKAPNTYIVIDTIRRTGSSRFTSNVTLRWWGTDPDGFVQNYRIITPDKVFTTPKQDTSLIINLPAGSDTFDFKFQVQAIDNEGLADPTPAQLSYPVKNSKPVIGFSFPPGVGSAASRSNPTYTFPVIKYSWNASDPDGAANLKYVEIVWNDTNRASVHLDPILSGIVMEGTDWSGDSTSARIYSGSQQKLTQLVISGMKLNALNTFYIRAVDQVQAKSKWISAGQVFLRKSSAKNLVVNNYVTSSFRYTSSEKFYLGYLKSAGITSVDTIRLNEAKGNYYRQLSPDNFTQSLVFSHFKGILWFGGNADADLALGQQTLQNFLNNGGRLFFATSISRTFDAHSSLLEFTPVDSIVRPPAKSLFAIPTDYHLNPVRAGYPILQSKKNTSYAGAFWQKQDAQVIYDAEILETDTFFKGKSTIMASKANGSDLSFVFFSGELDSYDYDPVKTLALFRKLFVDDLKFPQ